MFSSVKGLGGDKCAQVFVTDFKWSSFHPMKSKSCAGDALQSVIRDVGIPAQVVTDYAKEEMEGNWKKVVKEYHVKQTITEPYSPWQNRSKNMIDDLKRGIRQVTTRRPSPKRLWNYCGVWISEIRNFIAHATSARDGRVSDEKMNGETPEI